MTIGNLTLDPALVAVIGGAIVLVIQLLFCFLSERVWIRLIPTVLSALATAGCVAMMYLSGGWEVLGYLLLAIYAGAALLICGLGWILFAVIRAVR